MIATASSWDIHQVSYSLEFNFNILLTLTAVNGQNLTSMLFNKLTPKLFVNTFKSFDLNDSNFP